MGLRLELYGENWGVLTVDISVVDIDRYRWDIDNKIFVKVWMNYKKVVKL